MRIEICGGIASGKTTLAASLATAHKELIPIFEDFTGNGFLADFNCAPDYYAYETEISFLLEHMHKIKKGMLNKSSMICDFSLEQDYAYAKNNLCESDMNTFSQIYSSVIQRVSGPDIIILLECEISTMLRRISERSRASESSITAKYLELTTTVLKNHIAHKNPRVIRLNSDIYDFREPEVAAYLLSEKIKIGF